MRDLLCRFGRDGDGRLPSREAVNYAREILEFVRDEMAQAGNR